MLPPPSTLACSVEIAIPVVVEDPLPSAVSTDRSEWAGSRPRAAGKSGPAMSARTRNGSCAQAYCTTPSRVFPRKDTQSSIRPTTKIYRPNQQQVAGRWGQLGRPGLAGAPRGPFVTVFGRRRSGGALQRSGFDLRRRWYQARAPRAGRATVRLVQSRTAD